MLRVEIGDLERGPVEISGSVAVDDPVLEDVGFELAEAVAVSGRVSMVTLGRFFWRGRLVTEVRGLCRRCLAATSASVDAAVAVMFAEGKDPDDPSQYAIGPGAIELDEAVREELILATGPYLLCREDCKGLCAGCGTDLNKRSCDCQPPTDLRWAGLQAMKTEFEE
ncbi:MAG: DUF177 domain-containing protein [Gemmatimonadetes bacterium]|nr:DUF177 domain-containing protein [Gemmatimonadota bacterium]